MEIINEFIYQIQADCQFRIKLPMKLEQGNPRMARQSMVSIASGKAPPSPITQKKLMRIRKMPRTTSNSRTIPTQVSGISTEWAMLIVNQLWLKQQMPALGPNFLVSSLQLEDYKNSNGDMSTTVRVAVDLEAPGKSLS